MTKIKLCGLSRPCDVAMANRFAPDYIGFVFAAGSRRFVSREKARQLKQLLHPSIAAVGVFVNEDPAAVADLLNGGVIDMAQLHGGEDRAYIEALRALTEKPILQAFRVKNLDDIAAAEQSTADFVLLDSGGGTGKAFDWSLAARLSRPYFLAGGLDCRNVSSAVRTLHPFAVDVSSGIETDGFKDETKIQQFIYNLRKEEAI